MGGRALSIEQDDRFRTKNWFICEYCRRTNITDIKENSKRKKRQRMIFTDDPTWVLFKALAAEFGYDHGRMLAFLVGKLQKERELYDTAGQS